MLQCHRRATRCSQNLRRSRPRMAWPGLEPPTLERKHTITQTERIGPFLDGSVKVIEGRGCEPDGRVTPSTHSASFDRSGPVWLRIQAGLEFCSESLIERGWAPLRVQAMHSGRISFHGTRG